MLWIKALSLYRAASAFLLIPAVAALVYLYVDRNGLEVDYSKSQKDYHALNASYANYRAMVSDAGNAVMRQNAEKQNEYRNRIQTLDEQYTKELFDVQENLDAAIDGIGSNDGGLYVKPAKGGNRVCRDTLSKATGSTCMGDGEAQVRLSEKDAKALFQIAGYGDRTAVILAGCQEYIRKACGGGHE